MLSYIHEDSVKQHVTQQYVFPLLNNEKIFYGIWEADWYILIRSVLRKWKSIKNLRNIIGPMV